MASSPAVDAPAQQMSASSTASSRDALAGENVSDSSTRVPRDRVEVVTFGRMESDCPLNDHYAEESPPSKMKPIRSPASLVLAVECLKGSEF